MSVRGAARMRQASARARLPRGEMNATERRFYEHAIRPAELARNVLWWGFQPVKLQIGVACYYEPDFLVVNADGETRFYEVKAWWPERTKVKDGRSVTIPGRVGWEEDARIKVKAAASRFPFWRFEVAAEERARGVTIQWHHEQIQSDGVQIAGPE